MPSVFVRPPAKLNLFLELLARRDDGFHEIDTVMVPIDWCDQMRVDRVDAPEITLDVSWLPSNEVMAQRLATTTDAIAIPNDASNLVHRALSRFRETFAIESGFHCQLRKSIPAGAGMGGASSDAAAALRCAARLCEIPEQSLQIREIAAEIGSDVPFFLGVGNEPISAARARGRGEQIEPVLVAQPIDLVVAFPNQSASTAEVYGKSRISSVPRSADGLVESLETGNVAKMGSQMINRLTEPAQEIAPRIDEILKSMWQTGLRTCQLTGSGSACFAIAPDVGDAKRAAARLQALLEPGIIVTATRTICVPPLIETDLK